MYRRLSKGVWIRLAIYLPLIGYLGYRGYTRSEVPPAASEQLAPHKKSITTPDGRSIDVYEVTPEQAEQLLGGPLPVTPKQSGSDTASAP